MKISTALKGATVGLVILVSFLRALDPFAPALAFGGRITARITLRIPLKGYGPRFTDASS